MIDSRSVMMYDAMYVRDTLCVRCACVVRCALCAVRCALCVVRWCAVRLRCAQHGVAWCVEWSIQGRGKKIAYHLSRCLHAWLVIK
jgi:hypothetical protein